MVASVFFLILTFSTLLLLIFGFFGYNAATNEQMKFEQEKAQEKILLTALGVVNQTYISYAQVNNTGTIQVKIRAIYEVTDNATKFLCDPSTYMDTTIDPSRSLVIWPSPNATYLAPFKSEQGVGETKLVLATERGTKTIEYEGIILYGAPTPPQQYDTSRYYLGPLELMFTAFYYRKTSQNGVYIPSDSWHPGWTINKGYGYVAWNITVRNIDNETQSIELNTFSSLTLVPNDSPSNDLTWYIEPGSGQNTQVLPQGQSTSVVFIWADQTKRGSTGQQIYTVSCRVLAFLTFYGWFHWKDGTTTTYGQTIPFEAAITII